MNKVFLFASVLILTLGQLYSQLNNEVLRTSACGLNFIHNAAKVTTRYPTPAGTGLPVQFNVNGLPADCYVIEHAYVWWIVSYEAGSPASPTVTVTNPNNNTTDYSAVLTGSGGNKCWNEQGTRGFRADVKNSITGNGNYTINLNTPVAETDGITFLITYRDLKANYEGHFVIYDGLITQGDPGGTRNASIPNINACAASNNANAFMIVSDIQDGVGATRNFILNGQMINVQSNFWNSEDGATNVAQNQVNSNFEVQGGKDCYSILMIGLYYQTTTCQTCPTQIVVSAAATPNEICLGQSVQLNASGGATYQWTSNPPGFNSNQQNPVVSPTVTTDYTVKGTSADGCLEGTSTVRVTVNPLPAVNAGTDKVICFGDQVSIGNPATNGTPPFNYLWSPNKGLSSTNQATVTASPPNTTEYTVTVTDSKGCVASDKIIVKVNPLPQPVIKPMGDTTFCSCDSVLLDAGGPYNTYQWSTGATTRTIIIRQSGNYNVTVTDSNGCKNTSPSILITVIIPKATINLNSEPSHIESGNTVRVPMYITDAENLDTCKSFNYTARITLLRSILVPADTSLTDTINKTTHIRTITINGKRKSNDSVLAILEFISTLGEDSTTSIRFESFDWTDCNFDVDTINTTFTLDGICRAGGRARLLREEQLSGIISINPNPASNIATIEYFTSTGSLFKFYLIDFSGKKVSKLFEGSSNAGLNKLDFNFETLSIGLYELILETQNQRNSKLIEIEK